MFSKSSNVLLLIEDLESEVNSINPEHIDVPMDEESMEIRRILAEGADHILQWRSPNFLYSPKGTNGIKLLLKNYRLSDDIAFRFSEKSWNEFPLTAPKYADWISSTNGNGNVVNLFMDYETFGEHQWEDTGIFEFIRHLPDEILKHPDNDFKTVSEVIDTYPSVGELDIHNFISWADVERDLSAWLGNRIQNYAAQELYNFEGVIKKLKNKALLDDMQAFTDKNWEELLKKESA